MFFRKKLAFSMQCTRGLLPCSLLLWTRKQVPSHERLRDGFQSCDAMLDRSLSLLKQRQSNLGELLLKGHDLGFQAGQFLDQIHLQRAGTGRRSERRMKINHACTEGRRLLLLFIRHRLPRTFGKNRKNWKWATMPFRHLQEVFLCHAFDTCICGMRRQGQMSFFEPVVQGFGMNPQHLSTRY